MFTHEQIWDGIEKLAKQNCMTTSALARKAGLDPTCFNKSKRYTSTGKKRWITTESLCKVLNVTHTKLSVFAVLIESDKH